MLKARVQIFLVRFLYSCTSKAACQSDFFYIDLVSTCTDLSVWIFVFYINLSDKPQHVSRMFRLSILVDAKLHVSQMFRLSDFVLMLNLEST